MFMPWMPASTGIVVAVMPITEATDRSNSPTTRVIIADIARNTSTCWEPKIDEKAPAGAEACRHEDEVDEGHHRPDDDQRVLGERSCAAIAGLAAAARRRRDAAPRSGGSGLPLS